MANTVGSSIIERGIFDPAHVNEAAVFAAWAGIVATVYMTIGVKHKPGRRDWPLLLLGLAMPAYALRYVFFGTRWGSNSSFAMVNLLFTSLCPAKILLPCPDGNPVQCQLKYPKLDPTLQNLDMYHSSADAHNTSQPLGVQQTFGSQQIEGMTLYETDFAHAGCPAEQGISSRSDHSASQQLLVQKPQHSQGPASLFHEPTHYTAQQHTAQQHIAQHRTAQERQHTKDARDLHFPVLVPLWQIYVREKPLPIFLHTLFMTVAALLWPLQLWKTFRQQNYALHRCLGYLALAATALGSLSAAPYAVTYLFSGQIPETATGLGYLGMYSNAGCFLVQGINAARKRRIEQHQLNMVKLVGLSWGVSPLGRILTVTPPIIWFPGPWNNTAVVCLSWPLGIAIAQCLFLSKPHGENTSRNRDK